MFKKFQQLVNNILESNFAGEGGAFGTPATPIFNPPDNVQSSDTYQPNNAMNIFGGVLKAKSSKKSKKNKRSKNKNLPLVIKRTLPKKDL